MMYGIMVLSVAYALESKYMLSALMYAILINFKHIYLYSAPAFGIFYLNVLVIAPNMALSDRITNFVKLAVQTLIVCAISFLPFMLAEVGAAAQLKQIGSRLFPFDRGLVHFYMAANAWELYVIFHKYVMNIYKWIQTGEKPPMEFDPTPDLQFYKLISLVATVVFLAVSSCFNQQKLIFLFVLACRVQNAAMYEQRKLLQILCSGQLYCFQLWFPRP